MSNAFEQPMVTLGLTKITIVTEEKTGRSGVLDNLICVNCNTAGIVVAADRHDHPTIRADVFKAAKKPIGDFEDVTFLRREFARIAPATTKKKSIGLPAKGTPQ